MVDYEKAKGIWQISKDKRILVEGNIMVTSGNYLFFFDGSDVTLLLGARKNWVYRSSDDVYRLKTKWEGRKLFYLPPFGEWTHLADFDGEQFIKEDQQHIWNYKKVHEDEVDALDKAVLKRDRSPHDYAIGPTGIKQGHDS